MINITENITKNKHVEMTFKNFNKTDNLNRAEESDFEIREVDLYFFDPQEEIPSALGRMGDGWVCLIEGFVFTYLSQEYPKLNIEDFEEVEGRIYYWREEWPEGYYIQFFPETSEWQAQIDNGECGSGFSDLEGSINEMESFLTE